MLRFRLAFAVAVGLCLVLGAGAQGDEDAEAGWESRDGVHLRTLKEGDCSKRVEDGDFVMMSHKGVYKGERDQLVQFDGNGEEPFKVEIGAGRLIRGMESGMYGMCIGETRNVLIPPKMAFDDPSRFIPRDKKPVPDGTTVMYVIVAEEIQRPNIIVKAMNAISAYVKANSATSLFALFATVIVARGVYRMTNLRKNFGSKPKGKAKKH